MNEELVDKFPDGMEPDFAGGLDQATIAELRRIRQQFSELRSDRLFHCTRVLVRPDLEKANEESASWEEFLDQATFHHSSFRLDYPAPRVQHLCFYGSRELVSQFTGLTQQAGLLLPSAFFPRVSFNSDQWEARSLRDQWMLGLYRLAYMRKGVLPITRDLQRNGDGALDGADRGFFDPLVRAGCCDESERNGYGTFLESFRYRAQSPPSYVYASLSLNVWESSRLAIDYVIDHWNSLFTDTCNFPFWDDIDRLQPFIHTASEAEVGPEGIGKFLDVDYEADNGVVTRREFAARVELSPLHRKLFRMMLNACGAAVANERLSNAWGTGKSQDNARIYNELFRLQKKIAPLCLSTENDRKLGYRLIDITPRS